ncbi:MAG: hypothetical protein WBN92_03020 [Terriglobia bacterium]
MSMINPSPERPQEGTNLPRIIGGIVAFFLLFALVAFLASRIQDRRRAAADEEMIRTAEESGSHIEINHVYFNSGENFLGDHVRYLNATLTNHDSRPVALLELTFYFSDVLGQIVLRESKRPIDEHKAALKPGESRQLAIGFEGLPPDWNHQHPAIKVTRLKFEK